MPEQCTGLCDFVYYSIIVQRHENFFASSFFWVKVRPRQAKSEQSFALAENLLWILPVTVSTMTL